MKKTLELTSNPEAGNSSKFAPNLVSASIFFFFYVMKNGVRRREGFSNMGPVRPLTRQ